MIARVLLVCLAVFRPTPVTTNPPAAVVEEIVAIESDPFPVSGRPRHVTFQVKPLDRPACDWVEAGPATFVRDLGLHYRRPADLGAGMVVRLTRRGRAALSVVVMARNAWPK